MFTLAFLIGIYSYIIFAFGIAGLLYKNLIIWSAIIFWGLAFFWLRKSLIKAIMDIKYIRKVKSKLLLLLVLIFVLQAGINLIGALGPELAFDALWYHLTLPKLYLENHSMFFIPGSLSYYSVMPQLGEMLYVASLALGNEILSKFLQFLFGLLACLVLYKLQRRFFNTFISMIGVLIFYSNLVVAWESITAYIDLIRTFYEIMALWAFINWWQEEKSKWLVLSAVMVGLAINTKILAIGSLGIFTLLIIFDHSYKFLFYSRTPSCHSREGVRQHKMHSTLVVNPWIPNQVRNDNKKAHYFLYTIKDIFIYWLIALAISLPWLIYSFFNTGNPLYSLTVPITRTTPEQPILFSIVKDLWNLFTNSSDPLSPLYIIFFPAIIFGFSKFNKEVKILSLYCALSLVVWYFTPRTGGGRFILPYLPAFSIICAACLNFFMENKKKHGTLFPKFLIILIILVSLISIGYRFGANRKYIPVLLGQETKQKFLTTHLNFAFGDFYDTDNFFENNIKEGDKVLLFGFHNLYYINFPFIHSSWLKAGDKFNYIATQNTQLPEKYKNWKIVYSNTKTMVKLYKR